MKLVFVAGGCLLQVPLQQQSGGLVAMLVVASMSYGRCCSQCCLCDVYRRTCPTVVDCYSWLLSRSVLLFLLLLSVDLLRLFSPSLAEPCGQES